MVFVVGAGASRDLSDSMLIGSTLAFNIEQNLDKEFSQGAPDGLIKTAIKRSPGGLTGADAIHADYQTYLKIVPDLIKAEKLDPYDRLSHTDFLWTVYTALEELHRQPSVVTDGK